MGNKIAIFGATGRLGRAIGSLICQELEFSLTEAITHGHSSRQGKNFGDLIGQFSFDLPITSTIKKSPDLIIDVSVAEAFPWALEEARKLNRPIVVGVTGLNNEQMESMSLTAREVPVFYSPNFSLGMALFQKLSLAAAHYFYAASTTDLFEMHHEKKRDAPSGSALFLAQKLKEQGRDTSIHSIRSGKIIGEHKLLLNCNEERLEITHNVHDRAAFARGALTAARFIVKQKPGRLYGMDDLINYG